jgi:hypothetical protein
MDHTKELRKNPGALRNMQHMGLECTIPVEHLPMLGKRFPGFNKSGAEQQVAHMAFLASEFSNRYRVRERTRG